MNEALTTLATTQGGVFTTRQARAAGLSSWALARWQRQGGCRRLAQGMYVVRAAEPLATLPEHERHQAEHRLLSAAVLLHYPDAALSHDSALLAHRLPVWRVSPDRVRVIRPVSHQLRTASVTADPWIEPVTQTQDGPAVAPELAIVQTARARGLLAGVVAADAALRSGQVTRDELSRQVERVSLWPDGGQAGAMLRFADPSAESPGESITRVVCTMAGFELEPQFTVRDRDGTVLARLDFRVKGTRVALEFDGFVKYADGDGHVLWQEKRREDRLRRLGWVVVRITWADLFQPRRLRAMIAEAVATAARRSSA